MPIHLDVLVDTPEQSLDMKTGLESLQGLSDATRMIAETVLAERTPRRLSHKGKVRTNLKKTFKGSYGQIFDLEVYDDKLLKRLRNIGRPAFIDLMQYFFKEAMYEEGTLSSVRAKKTLDKLGDKAEHLIQQLRVSALENIHQVPIKLDHSIAIRFRKSNRRQVVIGEFNKTTAKVLETEKDTQAIDLVVAITRLNINTGNGRLSEEGKSETVAFGFDIEYHSVKLEAKRIFSDNLAYNNGLNPKQWEYLKIYAQPIRLRDGKIVKYIVKGFYGG